jgi:pimeloyl-ACP methyl ester carboxylesterase
MMGGAVSSRSPAIALGSGARGAISSEEGARMPHVKTNGLRINYDVQGEGEPLLLIPYTSADHASYAFQLPAYAEHFSCIAIDLPGTGESDKPAGPYSTEGYADQVAAFLGAIGIERAHVAGVSLGAGVAMHLAARFPRRVRSLSLHSAWDTSDAYLKTVLELWRTLASSLPTVADVVVQAIFPLCFTPEMYVTRPEVVDALVEFVRGRPAQPVDAFLAQTDAAIGHDSSPVLGEIGVPTLITFGARDLVCSTRFAEPLTSGIGGSELVVFEQLSHAGLHEDPETFNRTTLDFLLRQRS